MNEEGDTTYADIIACIEGTSDRWIHLDHHLSLLDDLLVPLAALFHDPALQSLADHGVEHIDNPCLLHLHELLLDREPKVDIRLQSSCDGEELKEAESLVLGTMKHLHRLRRQSALHVVDDLLQEVDGDLGVVRKVEPRFITEQEVD